jgi:hypothetical protein
LYSAYGFIERASRSWLYRCCDARFDEFWHLFCSHEAKPSVFGEVKDTEFGFADTDGFLQHGIKHRLKFAGGAAYNLKYLGSCRLLFERLIPLAGYPREFALLAGCGRGSGGNSLLRRARVLQLSCIWPSRLAIAGNFGAPLHWLPWALKGILAVQTITPEEAADKA